MESSPPRPPLLSAPENLGLLAATLKASGFARYHLRGRSMHPTLREGWKLHIRSLPASRLRVGEIGVFLHRDLLTIHRLIWKKVEGDREKFIFQGDNSPEREMVEADAILGRVEAAEGEWSREGAENAIPVGNDSRAFFYHSAFRLHVCLKGLVPSAALPGQERGGGLPYRVLRIVFRLLEPIFSPRPRR